MLTPEQIVELEHNINNVWSLGDYLAHMNADARARMAAEPGLWCSEFTEELAHWNECGINTARDLADYLDACFQKEVRKSQFDTQEEDWDQYAAQRAAEQASIEDSFLNAKPVHSTLADLWPR